MSRERRSERRGDREVTDHWPNPDLIEYLVLTTSGLSSRQAVAPVLRAFVKTSQIRILDLVGVQTDALGGYRSVDAESLPGLEGIRSRDPYLGAVLSDDDIALVCWALGPNESALILVAEDRWARELADAAWAGGGRVVGGERIPRRSIEQSQRFQQHDSVPSRRRPEQSRRHRVDLLRRRPILDETNVPAERSS
jgi:hypothetical protein